LAALLRFSLSSTQVWLPWIARLRLTANTALTTARAHAGHLCFEEWGSEPFASTLAWAAAAFPLVGYGKPFGEIGPLVNSAGRRRWQRLHEGATDFIAKYHVAFPDGFVPKQRFPPPEGRFLGPSVQATARESLRNSIYDDTLLSAWRQRALKWFGVTAAQWDGISSANLQTFLSSIPKSVALQVLRTWSFAWVTSARFHDRTRLPCAFGCPNMKDAQEHYLSCPHLWGPIAAASGHPVPPAVFDRVAYNLNQYDAHNLAVVTNAYHTIRKVPRWRRSAEQGGEADFENNKILWLKHVQASRSRFADIRYSQPSSGPS